MVYAALAGLTLAARSRKVLARGFERAVADAPTTFEMDVGFADPYRARRGKTTLIQRSGPPWLEARRTSRGRWRVFSADSVDVTHATPFPWHFGEQRESAVQSSSIERWTQRKLRDL
jgi:hypothetical protein